ncbi:MAG: endonuclease V [Deltaproteobacteria bacterium]|nr:endonuclease V [Deltaproteobacteria bacterium]
MPAMLACTDVHYREHDAHGAALFFRAWTDAVAADRRTVRVPAPREYRPGHFYERELPVLLALLKDAPPLEAIVVDGYVWLGAAGEKGLGAHLFDALGGKIPVIGVAKTAYRGSDFAERVVRGEGKRPLFVTAVGIDPRVAAERVRAMHGAHRIPTLLGEVDRLARSG